MSEERSYRFYEHARFWDRLCELFERGVVEDIEIAWDEIDRLIHRLLFSINVTAAQVAIDNRKDTTMPLDLHDDDTAAHTATVNYLKADGTAYTGSTDGFVVSFTDSDNAVAATAADGTVTLTHADGTDSIGATITLPDGTVLTATPDTLTVTAAPPASATVTLA